MVLVKKSDRKYELELTKDEAVLLERNDALGWASLESHIVAFFASRTKQLVDVPESQLIKLWRRANRPQRTQVADVLIPPA